MEDLWTLEPITSLRRKCINKCTKQGEWTVLSHDATFKSLFSVLGQDKMSQKAGESTQCTPSWAKVVHCLASVRNTQRAKHASGMLLKPCYLLTRDKQHDGFSQTHQKQSWQQLQICIQVSLGWLKIQYIWSSASKPALENAEHHALAYVCIYRRSLQSLAPGSIYDGESSHELSQGPCFVPTLPFLKAYFPSIHTSRQYIMSPFRPVICRTMESRTNTAASCRSRLDTIFPSSLSTSPGLHRRHPRSVSSASQ